MLISLQKINLHFFSISDPSARSPANKFSFFNCVSDTTMCGYNRITFYKHKQSQNILLESIPRHNCPTYRLPLPRIKNNFRITEEAKKKVYIIEMYDVPQLKRKIQKKNQIEKYFYGGIICVKNCTYNNK